MLHQTKPETAARKQFFWSAPHKLYSYIRTHPAVVESDTAYPLRLTGNTNKWTGCSVPSFRHPHTHPLLTLKLQELKATFLEYCVKLNRKEASAVDNNRWRHGDIRTARVNYTRDTAALWTPAALLISRASTDLNVALTSRFVLRSLKEKPHLCYTAVAFVTVCVVLLHSCSYIILVNRNMLQLTSVMLGC